MKSKGKGKPSKFKEEGNFNTDNDQTILSESQSQKPSSLSKLKNSNVLISSGILDGFNHFLTESCKNGLPKGNVYELCALTLLEYEKNQKAKKANQFSRLRAQQDISKRYTVNSKKSQPQDSKLDSEVIVDNLDETMRTQTDGKDTKRNSEKKLTGKSTK